MTQPDTQNLVARTYPRIRGKVTPYVTTIDVGGGQRLPLPSFTVQQWAVFGVGLFAAWLVWKTTDSWVWTLVAIAVSAFLAGFVWKRLPIPEKGLWMRIEGYTRLALFWWVRWRTARPGERRMRL